METGREDIRGSDRPTLQPVIMAVPLAIQRLRGREQRLALGEQARAALARSAAYSGVVLPALQKGAGGDPLPSGGVHWSLSHTTDYVAAVTAPYPVGIDIERIATFAAELRARVAAEHEWGLAPIVDDTLFCRYWTAKEAVLKAVGAGLGGLEHCSVAEIIDERALRLVYGAESWTVSQCYQAAHHVAAITAETGSVRWHLLGAE